MYWRHAGERLLFKDDGLEGGACVVYQSAIAACIGSVRPQTGQRDAVPAIVGSLGEDTSRNAYRRSVSDSCITSLPSKGWKGQKANEIGENVRRW